MTSLRTSAWQATWRFALFQWFTEKPVLECAFAHPIMLFLSYLGKNSMNRVSVICKLPMKWYLMRMCTS